LLETPKVAVHFI